jgi:hypothetical protein
MPYTTVDIFREKGGKSFSKKVWKPLNFMKKYFKKITVEFFLVFNSKLSHFDKNLNLNHKWRSPWTFKTSAAKGFLKEYFPMHEPL